VTNNDPIDIGCGEFIDESGNRFRQEFIDGKWVRASEQEGGTEAASHDEAAKTN
jgi:hypothetical protein